MENSRTIIVGNYTVEITNSKKKKFVFSVNGKSTDISYFTENGAITGAISYVLQNFYERKKLVVKNEAPIN